VSGAAEVALEPAFFDGPRGRLFALEIAPRGRDAGLGVLLCPPFAEELNRTRRAAQVAARVMARHGCRVLLLDPAGTGDSDGDFADGTWDGWIADLSAGADRLRARGAGRLCLWGVRLGAALAVEVAARQACTHALLWQPVVKGAAFLTQFLRLRVAAEMLAAEGGATVEALRAELAAGGTVEVAGYAVGPALARAIDAVDLGDAAAAAALGDVDWMEAVAEAGRPLSVASRGVVERWQAGGVAVRTHAAVAQPFWGTPEIVVPAELVRATERAAAAWTGGGA
jgi:exosortase A-associated hydrolase 2